MPKHNKPRCGSLQYWPRKRITKFIPSANWGVLSNKKGFLGFICYKVGMASAMVKDQTEHSMTKGKNIVIPVSVLECPTMKIFSMRFYKYNKVIGEVLMQADKELKRVLKLPKQYKKLEDFKKDYDDMRLVVYSQARKTSIKKTPDVAEIGLSGTKEEKLELVKKFIGKEITINDVFDKKQLVDVRGLTKGKGLQGPVKRFGITLKQHKSEKGQRRPGSLGPWHPARVTFRVPMAGQLGMFTRLQLNSKIIDIAKAENKEFKNYGIPKNELLMLKGSVQGTPKRVLLVTAALRKTKNKEKKNFEFVRLE